MPTELSGTIFKFLTFVFYRIFHTVVLDDPFDDPSELGELIPDRSPEPTKEQLQVSFLCPVIPTAPDTYATFSLPLRKNRLCRTLKSPHDQSRLTGHRMVLNDPIKEVYIWSLLSLVTSSIKINLNIHF